jgi:hypothetical protein
MQTGGVPSEQAWNGLRVDGPGVLCELAQGFDGLEPRDDVLIAATFGVEVHEERGRARFDA